MFENINPMSKTTAGLEIFVMLAVSFGLGYLLHLVLSETGIDRSTNTTNEEEDLKIIEGIGPKIEAILHEEGIYTFEDIINAGVLKINKKLEEAGPRFAMHDTATWVEQAKLARDGKWEELKKLQTKLNRGKNY